MHTLFYRISYYIFYHSTFVLIIPPNCRNIQMEERSGFDVTFDAINPSGSVDVSLAFWPFFQPGTTLTFSGRISSLTVSVLKYSNDSQVS